jgi:sugar lactone lactonase YvrE
VARGSRRSSDGRVARWVGCVVVLSGCLFLGPLGREGWAVEPVATISTAAGTGVAGYAGDGGPAALAQLSFPAGLASDRFGNLFIADTQNHRIRRVAPSGTITTVAGTGRAGFSGDGGAAIAADIGDNVAGLASDTLGNLLFADPANSRVRKVSPDGIISTFAGDGLRGFNGDGHAPTATSFSNPMAVAVAPDGTVFVTEAYRVRRISPAGVVTTVAGTGTPGFSGDGGPATSALVGYVEGVTVDAVGDVYFSEFDNRRVRRVDAAGIIHTVAGNGLAAGGDGGPAVDAGIAGPFGLVFDRNHNLYIAEPGGNRVRQVTSGGTISTLVGDGTAATSGDGGLAGLAQVRGPAPLALAPSGDLYIGETAGNRVRRVTWGGAGTYEETSPGITFTGAWTATTNPADSGGGAKISGAKGAAAELSFTGTGVKWLAHRQPDAGTSDVYLDGAKVATVDLYSATKVFKQTVFERSGLAAGAHAIRVVRTGAKNSAATGTLHSLDAFVVADGAPVAEPPGAGTYQESNPNVTLSGPWLTGSDPGDNGGASAASGAPGAAAELMFRGTSIRWQTHRWPDGGIAAVYIDGVKVGTIDLYNATTLLRQTVYGKHDLAAGTHTIRVVRTGNKNPAAGGAALMLDAFIVV